MRLDAAAVAYCHTLLNFDKWTDEAVVAKLTAINVYRSNYLCTRTKGGIRDADFFDADVVFSWTTHLYAACRDDTSQV